MFDTLRYIVGAVFFFGVIAYALWKGDWPERVTGAAMLAATLLTPLVFRHAAFADPQWAVAAVDLALLTVLIIVVAVSRRLWLLLALSVHALGAASHIALIFDPNIKALAYLSSIVIWSYLANAFLLASVIQARRRRAWASGSDQRAWAPRQGR